MPCEDVAVAKSPSGLRRREADWWPLAQVGQGDIHFQRRGTRGLYLDFASNDGLMKCNQGKRAGFLFDLDEDVPTMLISTAFIGGHSIDGAEAHKKSDHPLLYHR